MEENLYMRKKLDELYRIFRDESGAIKWEVLAALEQNRSALHKLFARVYDDGFDEGAGIERDREPPEPMRDESRD